MLQDTSAPALIDWWLRRETLPGRWVPRSSNLQLTFFITPRSYLFTDIQLSCTLVWCSQISMNAKNQINISALEFAAIQLEVTTVPAHLGLTA
jgi:hypothetical protein